MACRVSLNVYKKTSLQSKVIQAQNVQCDNKKYLAILKVYETSMKRVKDNGANLLKGLDFIRIQTKEVVPNIYILSDTVACHQGYVLTILKSLYANWN